MRVTPAYLESVASFYDLLHTEPVGTHKVAVCTNISCWMRGGDELLDAFRGRRRGRRGLLRHRLRVPRRLRHRADGLDRRALLRPARGGRGGDRDRAAAGRRRGAAGEGAGRSGRWPATRRRMAAPMPETRVLLEHAEDPALRTLDGYKGYGGYATLEKAYRELEPDEILKELEDSGLRGRGGAGFSMGKKASFLPRGEMAKYLCCNADESEPGAFKDRELMQRNPHQLIEGIAIAALAADAGHAFIFIRGEYDSQADILDAAVAEAYEAGYLGEDILGTPPRPRAGRPPRRRRLHLRRGDGAARRARGQARQPAPEAAVPGGAGPLRRADADQQRRDALQRAAHRRQRRRVVQGLRHRAVARDQGRLGLRLRAPARQLRGRAGDPDPRADLRPRRRPRARATRSRPSTPAAPPPRSSPPRRASTSPTASRRWPRPARCSARARSSSPTTASRSRTWRCARRASTTTSPAASAPPAARAPTGR